MSSRIFRGFTLATLALALAACSSVPLDESKGTGAGADARGDGPSTGVVMDPFDPASPLSQDLLFILISTAMSSLINIAIWSRCTRAICVTHQNSEYASRVTLTNAVAPNTTWHSVSDALRQSPA